jgi:hypothetical protein
MCHCAFNFQRTLAISLGYDPENIAGCQDEVLLSKWVLGIGICCLRTQHTILFCLRPGSSKINKNAFTNMAVMRQNNLKNIPRATFKGVFGTNEAGMSQQVA